MNILLSELEMVTVKQLADRYIKPGGLALEIGTFEGGSALIIGTVCQSRSARLICVEPFYGKTVDTPELKPRMMYTVMRNLIGLPLSFLPCVSDMGALFIEDSSLDFCFVDGDHASLQVECDITNYMPKVKRGGVLFGHDYNRKGGGVRAVVDKLLGRIDMIDTIWIKEI